MASASRNVFEMEDPAAHVLAGAPFCPRIGGRRMLPLSLGHVSLLMSMNCAYVGGGKITLADSLVVWMVASRPWRKAWELAGLFSRRPAGFRDRLRRMWLMAWWKRLGRRWGFRRLEGLESALMEYVDSYFVLPPQWDAKGNTDPRKQTVTWPEHVATVLSTKTYLSRDEAYSLPVNDAVIRFLHFTDMMGAKRLMSPHDQAWARKANERAAEGVSDGS